MKFVQYDAFFIILSFLKHLSNLASCCLFSFFSQHNDKYSSKFDYVWKKYKLCAWDSNPDRRMGGIDESTELCRPRKRQIFFQILNLIKIQLSFNFPVIGSIRRNTNRATDDWTRLTFEWFKKEHFSVSISRFKFWRIERLPVWSKATRYSCGGRLLYKKSHHFKLHLIKF